MSGRILLVITVAYFFLHGFGVGADHQAGLFLARSAADTDGVVGNLESALRSGEDEPFALLASVDEVDAQAEVEALRIVEQAEQYIVGVAAVLPESDSSGG